ncbi:Protein angel 1 [Nowakowskiella sp. JEL0407]|nr:Protein angel 1 [Nowakowskiella sp. JEL0407]
MLRTTTRTSSPSRLISTSINPPHTTNGKITTTLRQQNHQKQQILPVPASIDSLKNEKIVQNPSRIKRNWIQFKNVDDTMLNFRFMSYNVLAHTNVEKHPNLYPSSFKQLVDWKYRSEWLLKDIKLHDSDIICLQEVDANHYLEFYQPKFNRLGYTSIFNKRLEKVNNDGVALFVKTSLFRIIDYEFLHYRNIGNFDRDNVGLIAILEIPSTSRRVCVANTHLLFNPRRQDIRFDQFQCLARRMKRMVEKHEAELGQNIPVVFAGDLNSHPSSILHQFITRGYTTMPDHQQRDITHDFDFQCTHSPYHNNHGVRYVSSLNYNEAIFVDYIFFGGLRRRREETKSESGKTVEKNAVKTMNLDLVRLLEPVCTVQRSCNWLVPGIAMPSDHIPLVVDFSVEA